MRNVLSSFIVALFALTGCTLGPTVRVDHDPGADFSGYKTFAFFDHLETDRNAYSSLVTEHLKSATRAELERLGYVYDEHAPQLRVNLFLNVQERQEIHATPSAGFFGLRFYSAWGGYDVRTEQYKAGTLSIDLVDSHRNSLVWEGVAEGKVSRDALADPSAVLGKVVAGLFSRFANQPPA